jgi:hypothetical protein
MDKSHFSNLQSEEKNKKQKEKEKERIAPHSVSLSVTAPQDF